MSHSHDYEKLDVWKRASNLAVDIYKTTKGFNDFSFRDQIRRAAISIPSNIAEGAGRDSAKEFSRFLKIAKGSAFELRTQLLIQKKIALTLNEPTLDLSDHVINESKEIASMLAGLIKSVESRI